jgi:hypothetical protein
MTTRQIDYTQFDGLIAEQILSQLGGERMLPTWTGTANQLDVVVDWLMGGEN